MEYRVIDKAELVTDGQNKPRMTRDGYMVCQCRIAKVGVQQYLGSELGIQDKDIVRVYRPESSVFSKDALASFAHKPVTVGHPNAPVDSKNYRDHSVGHLGGEVARDGSFVSVPLMLVDADAIEQVKQNGSELSCGYTMQLEIKSGVTDSGEEYDAIQHDIVGNHVALVDAGRAGKEVKIPTGDGWTDTASKTKSTPNRRRASKTTTKKKPTGDASVDLKILVVDGVSVETTDAGINAINKLQDANKQAAKDAAKQAKDVQDKHEKEINTLTSTHDDAIDAKDKELAAKDAEIDTLKKAQLSDAERDQLVVDRAELLTKATALVKDADFKGKSDLEIKTEVVKAVRGADSLEGKSEAYVEAAFDLCEVEATDSFRDTMMSRGTPSPAVSNIMQLSDSQLKRNEQLSNAWMDQGAKA